MKYALIPIDGSTQTEMNIFYPLYLVSLILFVGFGIVSIIFSNDICDYSTFRKDLTHSIFNIPLGNHSKGDVALSLYGINLALLPDKYILYGIVGILIILSLVVLVILLLKGSKIMDSVVYNIAFGNPGKFLPIPILLSTACLLIPLIQRQLNEDKFYENIFHQLRYGFGFCFSFICMAAFAFIYFMTNKCTESIFAFLFKKCFISANFAFHLFHFFYNVTYFYFWMDFDSYNTKHSSEDFAWNNKLKNISWICMLIFGGILGAGTWFLKDLCLAVMGILFQIGFIMYASGLPITILEEEIYDLKKIKIVNILVPSILMVVLSAEVAIVAVMKKKECLE